MEVRHMSVDGKKDVNGDVKKEGIVPPGTSPEKPSNPSQKLPPKKSDKQ